MTRRSSVGFWTSGRVLHTLAVLGVACAWVACVGPTGADTQPVSESAPLRIDREKLAGVGLEEYPPMPAEEVLEGGSGQRGEVFFMGDQLVVEVWDADASKLAITEPFPYDGFVTILSGKLVLTDGQGTTTEYSAGESLVVPKTASSW